MKYEIEKTKKNIWFIWIFDDKKLIALLVTDIKPNVDKHILYTGLTMPTHFMMDDSDKVEFTESD